VEIHYATQEPGGIYALPDFETFVFEWRYTTQLKYSGAEIYSHLLIETFVFEWRYTTQLKYLGTPKRKP
jgi:hypothetical protein